MKYGSTGIIFSQENVMPDLNVWDYAIGSHFLDFGDRYKRMPLFCLRITYRNLTKISKVTVDKWESYKFCRKYNLPGVESFLSRHPKSENQLRELLVIPL